MVLERPEVLRSQLEVERARLEAVIAKIDANGEKNLGYGNHMADDASEAFEQAKDLALRQSAEQTLAQITDALERFDVGQYGICGQCEAEIDPARLRALPYATLCLRCQRRNAS
jgi:DnaK suppressor protein